MMGVQGQERDWSALYKAASINLSTLKHRNALDAERRARRAEADRLERQWKTQERQERRELKRELREVTKECNRLDRKMCSKKGLTPDEHAAYEELDHHRWNLVRQLDPEFQL